MSAIEGVAVLSLPVWLLVEAVLASLPPTAPPSGHRPGTAPVRALLKRGA
jgi:hypothetical protein